MYATKKKPAKSRNKPNLMHELVVLAEVTHRRHIVKEDGEKCFNLYTFLEALEYRLETVLDGSLDHRIGRFELEARSTARLLWSHMAIYSGGTPDGTHFRGMPILD